MARKEELEQQLTKIQNELYAIREAERTKEENALVGKYFKYLNSYGGFDREKWWIYRTVYKTRNEVRYLDAQVDCDGKVSLEDVNIHSRFHSGWQEITKPEYKKGLAKVLAHIKKLTANTPLT